MYFAMYTRHLDNLFLKKNKCVALRNCLRKEFMFLIKSHHFPQLPPNSLHDAMIIFRILESSISKTLKILVRTERNRSFRAFQIVHYTSIFAILCQIIQILPSLHKVVRNKVYFLLKFSDSSTLFQSNFARTQKISKTITKCNYT